MSLVFWNFCDAVFANRSFAQNTVVYRFFVVFFTEMPMCKFCNAFRIWCRKLYHVMITCLISFWMAGNARLTHITITFQTSWVSLLFAFFTWVALTVCWEHCTSLNSPDVEILVKSLDPCLGDMDVHMTHRAWEGYFRVGAVYVSLQTLAAVSVETVQNTWIIVSFVAQSTHQGVRVGVWRVRHDGTPVRPIPVLILYTSGVLHSLE